MLKWAFTFGSILLLSGCADPIGDAKQTLESGVLKNLEVKYRNTQSFPGDVVCGEVNAFDRWGSGAGYKRFIVRAHRADTTPSEDDWVVFCSEDQAAALKAQFGIDLIADQNSSLQTIQQQLTAMDLALQQYLADNRAFPLTTQGLVSASTSSPDSKNLQDRGYIDKIPEDPWGRPYHYEKLRRPHPAPKAYKLYTLGKDGVEGGTGENADISNKHLKYLNHLVKR